MNMHPLAVSMRTLATLSSCALCCMGAQAAVSVDDLLESPTDLTARVTESLGTGLGTVLFDQSKVIEVTQPDPLQRAELLHLSDLGGNGSGRSTQITRAFGSATAQSDKGGGVGVSMQTERGLGEVHRMTAEALFSQTVENHAATGDATLALELHIPGIEVGLLGVPPFTSAPRATETAQATAELETFIDRAGGSRVIGPFFQFGMLLTETQIELAPGTFSNFADVKFLFENVGALSIPLNSNDSKTSPRFSFDPITLTPALGTLHPGDSVTYVYSLTAIETTAGGEGKGAFAFIGDPFNVIGGANLVPVLIPVPEPASAAMLLAGLTLLGWRRFGRGGAQGGQ